MSDEPSLDRDGGGTWCVSLSVPAERLPLFEAALEGLGGALVSGEPATGMRPVLLQLYLDSEPDSDSLGALLVSAAEAAGVAPPTPSVERLPPRDWVAESQAALPPIRSRRFFVHGGHVAEAPPPGRWPLLIEAAAAFGTGRHETTWGCLSAMETLARGRRYRRVLDMGCGSGILALAAARLWPAARVLGVDNDAGAVAVARRNARANRLSARAGFLCNEGYRRGALRGLGISPGRGAFDLVVANILARPLAAMAPDLRRALAPGGNAILAGLLTGQERQVMAPHEALGLSLVRRVTLGDWAILLLRG